MLVERKMRSSTAKKRGKALLMVHRAVLRGSRMVLPWLLMLLLAFPFPPGYVRAQDAPTGISEAVSERRVEGETESAKEQPADTQPETESVQEQPAETQAETQPETESTQQQPVESEPARETQQPDVAEEKPAETQPETENAQVQPAAESQQPDVAEEQPPTEGQSPTEGQQPGVVEEQPAAESQQPGIARPKGNNLGLRKSNNQHRPRLRHRAGRLPFLTQRLPRREGCRQPPGC
jgi:outer membrane biosynthesis protein TonB